MHALQILLQGFGIKIDAAEIEGAFQKGKNALPELAASFKELAERQKKIEDKLDALIKHFNLEQSERDAKTIAAIEGVKNETLSQHVNGQVV